MKQIIEVENLSKSYTLGKREAYGSLRDEIMQAITAPFKRMKSSSSSNEGDTLWALKDISFEVNEGEVVGIIGRNGAGKSTLLKILSRITEPTSGKITMRGRVASLLEVGTGFHPELTGRENIFLNGALLGMINAEIRRKFDEIVAFSEIEKFLDTPVKRYSSGMYVRLAFAVAAHLEPEILVIDEVLAVGDAEFQKKCLGKMGDVAKGGRTVLFVSHNMGAVRSLCQRCLMLEQGTIAEVGTPDKVIERYLSGSSLSKKDRVDLSDFPRSAGNQKAILEAWIENEYGTAISEFPMGSNIKICYRFKANKILRQPAFGLSVHNSYGDAVFSFASYLVSNKHFENKKEGIVIFEFKDFPLLPGNYVVSFGLAEEPYQAIDSVAMALSFSVVQYDLFCTGKPFESGHGTVFVRGNVYVKDLVVTNLLSSQ